MWTETPPTAPAKGWAVQAAFDELGRPLAEATFLVVDLETTGGSAAGGASITEIGAVKVRHGEVLGEFETLVRPHQPIPAFISVLTGITDAMVADAPRIDQALPAFLEFARGCVLVAHNAPFDVGFLRHHAAELGLEWPAFEVVDTVKVARHTITRDESPNCKLSSLARLFGASTTPNHRALADARATVDVLHGLIERLGTLGVHTLEELQSYTSRVSPAQRKKRHLAEPLPSKPGVYLFVDGRDQILYVGTSRDVKSRVRTYFTASETRSRMGEMVRLAERVDALECATPLEAEVREMRLIMHHQPPYNRRSRRSDRVWWVKVTVEPWPRLSVVRQVSGDGADYFGPFRNKRQAESAVTAIHEAFPVRQCTDRLPRRPQGSRCALGEMGRCLSPCDGSVEADAYAAVVEQVRSSLRERADHVVEAIRGRMATLAADQRFEEATAHRDRMTTFVRAAARFQRLVALTQCPEIVAARRNDEGRWEVHVVRFGRLAAAGVIPEGASARTWIDALRAGAETVLAGDGPAPAATTDESEALLRWIERPGVRLVHIEGEWTCPVGGAGSHHDLLDAIDESRRSLVPFDTPRASSVLSRA